MADGQVIVRREAKSAADSRARPQSSEATTSRALSAFAYSVPIGLLGGLIGLGGAEFRLPVLAGPLKHPARQAVPLNLLVSLFTLVSALAFRGASLSSQIDIPWSDVVAPLVAGSFVAAYLGTGLVRHISNARLHQAILVLLVGIGLLLMAEGVLPNHFRGPDVETLSLRIAAGLVAGVAIGLVSSMLGVAGGELIIPTLLFVFAVDIKTAGTASLIISLPMVVVGSMRYALQGAFSRRALAGTVAPMGVGSLIGAAAGGLLVGIVEPGLLKLLLGLVLIGSAFRIFCGRGS